MTKKFVSMLLALAMCLTLSAPAWAEENQERQNSDDNSRRTESAFVDVSCLTTEALDAIEQYVCLSNEDRFVISDEQALSEALTEEQYQVVLDQMEAINQNRAVVYAAALGTESNPFILVDGGACEVTSANYWFTCTTFGATDVSSNTAKSASIKIYKKTLFGKTLLKESSSYTSMISVISDCTINNGKNQYIINIVPQSSAKIYCLVETHVDKKSNSKGAQWTPYDNSAMYNIDILYLKYWYVGKDDVGKIRDMVTRSNFLDYQSAVVNGTMSLAMFLTGLGFPVTEKLMGIAGIVTAFIAPVDFQKSVLNEIDNTAVIIGQNEQGEPIYEKGCLIVEYMCNGITFYSVRPWSGTEMEGPEGWTGKWILNN